MKRIFTKFFGGFLIAIVVFSALILFFSFKMIRASYIDSISQNLYKLNLVLKYEIKDFILRDKLDELDAFVKKRGDELKTRITVIAPDGTVYADSEKDPRKMENHADRPEVLQLTTKEIGKSMRYSTTVRKQMLYVATSISNEGKALGVCRASLFLEDVNTLIGDLTERILKIALIVILLTLIVFWFFSKSLTWPIKQLALSSRMAAGGDFDAKVLLSNRDEIRELADNFNYMLDRVKELFSKVTEQKEELDGIISSMREGLMLLNFEGKVLLANKGFKLFCGSEEVEGKFYWELVRENDFGELINKTLKNKGSYQGEFDLKNKILLYSANYIDSKDEVVVILHDITEIKKLEIVKKDFVANVSHELKTPLTAINGFIETLEERLDGENRRYAQIIDRHAKRLSNIVADLLALSEIEDKSGKPALSEFDARALCESIVKIYETRAYEKGLEILLEFESDMPNIVADRFRLEQALVNLIDNAIKYADKGAIVVSVRSEPDAAIIQISDSGAGIPKDDLERIFERFYTVDKSRSRKVGGTGLGLSIVKHIVKMHGGSIKAESVRGEGSTFTIKLPMPTETLIEH